MVRLFLVVVISTTIFFQYSTALAKTEIKSSVNFSNMTSKEISVKYISGIETDVPAIINNASPTSILENKEYTSTINNLSDINWYSIDISKVGKMVTTLNYEGLNLDIELFNPNGERVGGSHNTENMEEKVDFLVSSLGRYYIKVYSNTQKDLIDKNKTDINDSKNDYTINKYPDNELGTTYRLKTMVVLPDAFENNDSYAKAKQINLISSTRATIDNQKDEDWYKFDVSQKTKSYLMLKDISEESQYILTIFDSKLKVIKPSETNETYSEYGEDIYHTFIPGKYYVKVSSYKGYSDQNEYKLILNPNKLDDFEYNNSVSTAKSIKLGEYISATIHNASDQDWYKVHFDKAGKMDIELSNIPTDCNYEMELYNSKNKKIGESKQVGYSEEVIWSDVVAGEYYIKVYTAGGFNIEHRYALLAYNNKGLADVVNIKENSTNAGTIVKNYGSNWYQTTITQNGVFSMNLKNIPTDCYYKIIFYEAKGQKLAKSDSISIGQESIDFIITEPGKYFIKVYSIFGSNETAEYTLTTKLTAVADLDVPEGIAEGLTVNVNEPSREKLKLYFEDDLSNMIKLPKKELNELVSIPKKQTKVPKGFITTIEKRKLPKQKAIIKSSAFNDKYTTINEQSNCTIRVNGINEAAQVLNYNSIVNGSLQTSDTNDYYIFSSNQRGKAIVELNNALCSNIKVYFTGQNWAGQYCFNEGVHNNTFVSPIITDSTSQFYIIRIEGSGLTSSTIGYELKITFMPEEFVKAQDPNEIKENDNFEHAPVVNRKVLPDSIFYAVQEATIDFKNDYDIYKLKLDSGYKFSAILKSPERHRSYRYVLLDSTLTAVQEGIYTVTDQTKTEVYELLYNVPTTGTYYLVVFSNEHIYYNAFSKYKIDFYSTKNNESTEFNHKKGTFNDVWENPATLVLDKTYSFKLDMPYDCDVYEVGVAAEGKLTINLDKKGYVNNYSVFIGDLSGDIYEYMNSKSSYEFYAEMAGKYIILVIRKNMVTPSAINYDIKVDFTPKTN